LIRGYTCVNLPPTIIQHIPSLRLSLAAVLEGLIFAFFGSTPTPAAVLTLTRQYLDPNPKKRPFHQISYSHKGRGRSEYVRPENLV